MAGTAGNDVTVCEGNDAQIIGYAIHHDNLQWTTSGDGTFDDATIAMPIYTPGTQDIENGQATLTITINGGGETITDEMTVNIIQSVSINSPVGVTMCAVSEPQPVWVEVESDYNDLTWSTNGDGVFENPHEPTTNYIPGPQDIDAMMVELNVTATSEACSSAETMTLTFSEPPQLALAAESIEICENDPASINFTLSGTNIYPPVDLFFGVTLNGEEHIFEEAGNHSIDLGNLEPGEHVFNINSVRNNFCQVDYEDGERTVTVTVNAAPTMTIGDVPASICEGETIDVEFIFTGMAPFMVEATGMDGFTAESDNYTLNLTPATTLNATLTKVTDANGCETTLEQAINVVVNPVAAQPEISGDAELDVRLTPTTTYTVSNDVEVGFSIEPEEAGTLVPANDGKSVVVTWSETYKGDAVLTATPVSECNNGEGTLNILVKNSTDVNEFGVKANLYPNPTNGNITIEAEGMQRLTVVNELGQVVYDAEVSNDTETLNMSQFGSGVYMIRIYTENGMGVKRVSVIR